MQQPNEYGAQESSAQRAVTLEEITAFAEQLAPRALAMEGDNVGLLVNSGAPVQRILCTLDITRAVVQEAQEKHCDLIVAHHPVIYRPLHALNSTDVVYRLAQKGMSALCLHTNLDAAAHGVKDTLDALLGVEDTQVFGCGLGRLGTLRQPATAENFLQRCQALLGAGLRYTLVPGNTPVQTVAVLGGSGGSDAAAAFAAGADAYVTGEAGHHHGVDAVHNGKLLVVAGHFATEHPVVQVLAEALARAFTGVQVLQSQADADPYRVLL